MSWEGRHYTCPQPTSLSSQHSLAPTAQLPASNLRKHAWVEPGAEVDQGFAPQRQAEPGAGVDHGCAPQRQPRRTPLLNWTSPNQHSALQRQQQQRRQQQQQQQRQEREQKQEQEQQQQQQQQQQEQQRTHKITTTTASRTGPAPLSQSLLVFFRSTLATTPASHRGPTDRPGTTRSVLAGLLPHRVGHGTRKADARQDSRHATTHMFVVCIFLVCLSLFVR
ncbi:unnamed protein product [Polarella glacialis]|uniref:Uncharacterized protein n=1 Tax=Polarella glacialis TaxID=89957 RepID=A0A813ERP3_POLGL|nr:unnamed protein product [Polarella glacialis]